MGIDAIKDAIVNAVNSSNYQVNFIERKDDGLLIEVQRPTKFNNQKSIRGLIRQEEDIGKFQEAIAV